MSAASSLKEPSCFLEIFFMNSSSEIHVKMQFKNAIISEIKNSSETNIAALSRKK